MSFWTEHSLRDRARFAENPAPRLASYLEPGPAPQETGPLDTRIVGVLKGVGIGPDVIDASI